ncbi:MAG: DUF2079 domain-containing protein [Cyanobacteria bacterium P01_E01_bin.34]
MQGKLDRNTGWKWAIAAAATFFTLTLILTLNRHLTLYSDYDQGIFNQVFWNNWHGRFFQSSLSSQLSTNVAHSGEAPEVFYRRLGQHFTPALLIWWPIYALFPNPATLTVLQVTLVTAAGLVLFALARHYLEPAVSVAIAISYYCANTVLGPTLANFHDICQLPLYIFGILLAMEKRWWWLFALLCCCTVAVREDSGVALFGVGVYMLASRRFPRIGLAVCLGSFAYVVLVTSQIMPMFSDDVSKRFLQERFGQYLTFLGDRIDEATIFDVMYGVLRQPWNFVSEIFSPIETSLLYFLGQALPLALIPVIAPGSWLVAGPPLLQILAAKGAVFSLNIRYAMTVVPGMFYGAILWWSGRGFKRFWQPEDKLERRSLKPKFRRWWTFCIVVSALVCVGFNPNRTLSFLLPDSYSPRVYLSWPENVSHSRDVYTVLSDIPPDATVSATTNLIPHLSGRRALVRFPQGVKVTNDDLETVSVDYAVADLWRANRFQVAFSKDREILERGIPFINELLESEEYGLVRFDKGITLLQLDAESDPEAIAAWQEYYPVVLEAVEAAAER